MLLRDDLPELKVDQEKEKKKIVSYCYFLHLHCTFSVTLFLQQTKILFLLNCHYVEMTKNKMIRWVGLECNFVCHKDKKTASVLLCFPSSSKWDLNSCNSSSQKIFLVFQGVSIEKVKGKTFKIRKLSFKCLAEQERIDWVSSIGTENIFIFRSTWFTECQDTIIIP